MLIDYTATVKLGEKIQLVSTPWSDMYPMAELKEKRPSTFGLDLYMAAELYDSVTTLTRPRPINGLMNACKLGYKARMQNVYDLTEEFNDVLKALYGPRKFRPFTMPFPSSA